MDSVPYHLMPLTAVGGLYTLYAAVNTIFLIAPSRSKEKKKQTAMERLRSQPQPSSSSNAAVVVLSMILSLIAYSFLNARVQAGYLKNEYNAFDPYALLGLAKSEDLAAETIQDAFKKAVTEFKNNGTGNLEKLQYAYQALADERGILNYQRHGHPAGPLEVDAYRLRIPSWLVYPVGPYAWGVWLVYALAIVGGVGYFVLRRQQEKVVEKETTKKVDTPEVEEAVNQSSVSSKDLVFLLKYLKPEMHHVAILLLLCATPDNLAWGLRDLARVERAREVRRQKDLEEAQAPQDEPKKTELDLDALLNEGGWDEDGDNTYKEAKKEKKDGKKVFEGMDKGVLGQKWVEKTLAAVKQWPPPELPFFSEVEHENGKGMKHPGFERISCMIMGRLNSMYLNSHPELQMAGQKKLIDQSYFQASMQFRQRVGIMLEASLRLAMMLRSYRLTARIVETVALFRIGCYPGAKNVENFEAMMRRNNGAVPRLAVNDLQLKTADGHAEIATGDKCEIEMEVDRLHAEAFTKAKVAFCEKQGIPPQVALQGYREGWWMLLRSERIGGATPAQKMNMGVLKDLDLDSDQLRLFAQEPPTEQLVSGVPLISQHIAQKKGKFKVRFLSPDKPGKYKFTLTVKSQDFLGADSEHILETEVVAAAVESGLNEEDKKDK